MNDIAILSVEQALWCEPQQEVLYVEHGSQPVASPIEAAFIEKFSRGLTVKTTVY